MKWWMVFLAAGLSSCTLIPRPAKRPLPVMHGGAAASQDLVVLLPGRWSRIREFDREGFFKIAAQRWPKASLVAADLHIGYYRNRSAARALHEDVIAPAVHRGVRKVTLVGISMGGLGALMYDLEHPGVVDELVLLSPYVGEEEAWREVASAGGVRKWSPAEISERDYSRRLWLTLREKWIEKSQRPAVFLGCGHQDRLAESNRRFAVDFLEPEMVLWMDGGHDWPTWRELLRRMPAR